MIQEEKFKDYERVRSEIIAFVEQSIHRGGGTPISQEQENKWIAWLEKKGEWKPSDEQIEALNEVIRNPYLSTAEYNGLIALREQFKAL